MKKLFLLSLTSLFLLTAQAQVLKGLGEKAKAKINERIDRKDDKAIDKKLDDVEGIAPADEQNNSGAAGKSTTSTNASSASSSASATLSYNSKYDFVPGERVYAFEDFGPAAVGDFPTRWNTNATAEVVT